MVKLVKFIIPQLKEVSPDWSSAMIPVLLVLALILAAYWRSLAKILVAALVVLLVIGGVQAFHAIDALVTVSPR
jgi:uncharacterized membrane protein YjdF